MKWIKTIRVRFALWTTALILAFLATFGAVVYFTFNRSLYGTVDDALVLSAQQVLASLYEDDGALDMPKPGASAPHLGEFNAFTQRGLTLIILSADGKILESVGPYESQPLAISQSISQPEFDTIAESENVDRIRV